MEEVRAPLTEVPKTAASKQDPASVFSAFATAPAGLSEAEARARLGRFGFNELKIRKVTAFDVLIRQLHSPMIYLLAIAAAVSIVLQEWTDGVTILVILLINTGIGFFQEYRSEQVLEKLRERLSPRSRVRRGGEVIEVDRRQIVPGDVVILTPGDKIPADVRVVVSRNLTVDETALTGESRAVVKETWAEPEASLERARNMAYQLTEVVTGAGEGIVTATGVATVIGGIAKLAEETPRISVFEENIRHFSGFLLKTVLAILAAVFAVNVLLKGQEQLVPQFLFAIALAVSVVPEALPAIVSVTLSRGAMRLAKRHVVVKRLSAIEDLGHIEVLCTDKTGTLTEGVMDVKAVEADDAEACLALALGTAEEEELRKPSHTPKTFTSAMAAKAGSAVAKRVLGWKRLWYSPFDPVRRCATAVFDDGKGPIIAMLGAPEVVIARSVGRMSRGGIVPFGKADADRENAAWRADGAAGCRVLALAVKRVGGQRTYGEEDEKGLTYVGRISFIDPLKATAKRAVADARAMRVAVKILTGDSPEVAGAVALQAGVIESAEEVVSGEALEKVTGRDFIDLVAKRHVFARITPEQKFRIIKALESDYQVGFLGEGINDAPALKAANVALAVDGASDVAREAADIILLKKDLHVIIDGIRDGRAIFTNIIKYIRYTLIGNFGNFLAIAGISLLMDDLPMLPIQILLTNLLTDLPLITVAGDQVDASETAAPKRFNMRELAFMALFLGLVSSFFDFAFFAIHRHLDIRVSRTLWFIFSVLTELSLIYSVRTRGPFWKSARPSLFMVLLTGLAAVLTILVTEVPRQLDVFQFIRPRPMELMGVLLLTVAYFAMTETVKLLYARSFKAVPDKV